MTMKKDFLNRQEFVDELVQIVESISEVGNGCCFSIDGKWGAGKTFVLEMFMKRISDIYSEETADNKYFVFNYNCWRYDYYKEPSVAIVSSMLDVAQKELAILNPDVDRKLVEGWKLVKENLAKIAGKFVEKHVGIDLGNR